MLLGDPLSRNKFPSRQGGGRNPIDVRDIICHISETPKLSRL